jgi:ABC-type transport system involved in multi-copper enzyme maturation permease subunit
MLAGFAALIAIVLVSFIATGNTRNSLATHPTTFYMTYLGAVEKLFTIAGGAVLLVAGSRLVSMEYGSGTIRIVLARGTSRLGLLAAQWTALALVGLALLATFVLITATALYAVVTAWHGDFSPITSLPSVAWRDTWLNVLVALVSIGVCILLGTGAAALGRSVAFGVGVAIAFFPTDNFGVVVLGLLTRITHFTFWNEATQWLLGPNLNQLPISLQPEFSIEAAFATPLVAVSTAHVWAVIGTYSLVFFAVAVLLTWRRDVLN